jgi:hypothetical protein
MWILVIMTTQLGTNEIYRDDKQENPKRRIIHIMVEPPITKERNI